MNTGRMLRSSQLVYISLELLMALLAVAGNVLVCWAVCLNSNLQSITNFFVVSLAVADIAVGLLAVPFAITISIGFCANFHGCLFIACFVLILTQSSIFSLLAIAVDRYIAIKNPLRYSSLVTGHRAKAIIALCWLLSVVIGLTPMMGWNRGWNSTAPTSNSICPDGLTECLFEGVVTMDYMIYFNFFGCVLLPLLLMLLIYTHIFMAARRQLRLMGLKVAQAPSPGEMSFPSKTSRSTLQREVHAAKSLAIIVGLFAFCWLPLHIINCFNHLCQDCGRSHFWLMNMAIILSHANSVVNPFIYAYRLREFRHTFWRIVNQHILGRRDGRCFGAAGADDPCSGSSSIMRTSSHTSKEGSSCCTVVDNCGMDRIPPSSEASTPWRSQFRGALRSLIPNEHQGKGLSVMQAPQCIVGFAVQGGVESVTCGRGTSEVLGMYKSEGCISFVNVHTVSLQHSDGGSTHPTQVSSS